MGVTDFVLKRLRSFQGVANTDVTVVEISRDALEVMVAEVPEVATAMQVSMLQLLAGLPLESNVWDVMQRSPAGMFFVAFIREVALGRSIKHQEVID